MFHILAAVRDIADSGKPTPKARILVDFSMPMSVSIYCCYCPPRKKSHRQMVLVRQFTR